MKSDGQLLITDFRSCSEFSDFDKLINENFEIISYEDITDNILLALDEMSEKERNRLNISYLISYLIFLRLLQVLREVSFTNHLSIEN